MVSCHSRWVNVPEPPVSSFPLSTSASTSSMTTQPGGCESHESDSEQSLTGKLTISHEDAVKGIVIKGVVVTPKMKNKSNSIASLNPFEKRLAPKPPPISESVPKTKATKRRVSKKLV